MSITEQGLSLIDLIAPESEALYDRIEARYGEKNWRSCTVCWRIWGSGGTAAAIGSGVRFAGYRHDDLSAFALFSKSFEE